MPTCAAIRALQQKVQRQYYNDDDANKGRAAEDEQQTFAPAVVLIAHVLASSKNRFHCVIP